MLMPNHINELKLETTLENKNIFYNLDYKTLLAHEKKCKDVVFDKNNCAIVDTGIFTGRSPKDRYIVEQSPSKKYIYWGDINKKISKKIFNELFEQAKKEFSSGDIYINDAYCGSTLEDRLNIRVLTKKPWQSHFIKNMFISPTKDELKTFRPNWTLYNASDIVNKNFKKHNLNSEVFVILNLEEKKIIIGGTSYTGEMKKGFFSVMNYILPLNEKLSMHCSANIGENHDTCLFFGLSGTGKTTLSTSSNRSLIGDDEHGWGDDGVFNFEGGCYAKVINLDGAQEKEIYEAIKTNALLENTICKNGEVDYKDTTKTQNTRVSYPINHIKNYQTSQHGDHPKNIIFLSADAFGVLPPVSKLDIKQAMYYFLSGYSAKVAGTERGVDEPIATFSSCFGEVFMPHDPNVYAKLLGEKIKKHKVDVYLINTGWSGGSYGVGKRISIKDTRACVDNILSGDIKKCEFEELPIFNLQIPKSLNGVDKNILNPMNCWQDKNQYLKELKKLHDMFEQNYKKYSKL